MDTPANEMCADELTLRSVDERIKKATGPILRRVEELCTLLTNRAIMHSVSESQRGGICW